LPLQKNLRVVSRRHNNLCPHPTTDSKPVQQTALNIAPLNLDLEVTFNRANINYKNKKYDIALEDLSKIISQDPNYTKAYLLGASIYQELNDNDKSLQDLNKSIELPPSLFMAYLKRAEIYFLQNKDDRSPIDFGKIIKLNPKLGAAYIGIAKVYAKKRR
jgi:tetratricopeptide (TPR) repeat protein